LRFTVSQNKAAILIAMKSTAKIIYLNLRRILLSPLRLLFAKKPSEIKLSSRIKKILFIRIDRIGDLVLSTPALRVLKQRFPQSELVVLVSPSNQSLLLNNPYVDKVFAYDKRERLVDKIGVIQQLRGHGFDLAIDPYPDYEVKTALVALLSGAKRRIGYSSYGRDVFFSLKGPGLVKDKHQIDLTLDILRPLGVGMNDKKPEIFLTNDEKQWARNWLRQRSAGGKPIVGIHPGAYYESQKWPPDSFAEVARRLRENKRLDVIIFGGLGDKDLVEHINSMTSEDTLTHVQGDLRQFAALLSHCTLLICNNSGPLHVAVALGVPTISFMGPTNKERWMPIGDIHKVLRIDDLPCIGCNMGYCKIETHDCMRLISPSMVTEAARSFVRI